MIAVVIPTYNEAENIALLIEEILCALPQAAIIVVDDSSTDGTLEAVRTLAQMHESIYLLARTGTRDFAQSYLDGFLKAFELSSDIIIQMDADFSHDPAALPSLVGALNDFDCAIGSRYVMGGKTERWSRARLVLSSFGNAVARAASQTPLRDITSGFVAWRGPLLKAVLSRWTASLSGYAFQIELKRIAAAHGARICEIPITFRERQAGFSKMNMRIVYEAIAYCFRRFLWR